MSTQSVRMLEFLLKMKGNQSENMDDMLDIGSALKKEKTFKENQEKIAKLKAEHASEENKEAQESVQKKDEVHLLSKFVEQKASIKQIGLFLLLIIFIAVGIRMYVASMPVTEEWAEIVVSASVKNQVTDIIYKQYPTLSESKKDELILLRTNEEMKTAEAEGAIKKLAETYKESYRDPEATSYLYEIDPYYFYELANYEHLALDGEYYGFLPSLERWTFLTTKMFIQEINFVQSIFYLPVLFTVLCSILVFFITREIWNETASFIAALFFVVQPVILEFSIPGFVDTNMLNIFFILATGFVFMIIVKFVEQKKRKQYLFAFLLSILLVALLILFKYNWSTWYVAVLLIVGALACLFVINIYKTLANWKKETKTKKSLVIGAVGIFILLVGFMMFYEKITIGELYEKIPISIKKYLHLEYNDPYGEWPDAFALIKELQTTDMSTFIGYVGGNIFVFISIPVFMYLLYLLLRGPKIGIVYIVLGYFVFCILSFRAIRVLPYFIPFFAITFGIGLSVIMQYGIDKVRMLVRNEKKTVQLVSVITVVFIVGLPFVYPLLIQDLEKSRLMPIMDDAIYNSAIFIKEQSNETAKVSTWWDRGTFYKALTEREVHMHSQPHMPTTYWLATFYNTESEVQAKNILSMMNCDHAEKTIFNALGRNFSNEEVIEIMKQITEYEKEEERHQYVNATLGEGEVREVSHALSCEKEETYVVVIDDLMSRYSAVQYFAAWDYETKQPDPRYPYTDLTEGGCSRSQSGAYCSLESAQFFLNFTSMEVQSNIALPKEVYLVQNNTVQYKDFSNETTSEMSLIVYSRAGYWKMLYVPKVVADGMYVNLMLLDGYNLNYFEKVFDEVHAETSWVKVYKVNWDAETAQEESKDAI